MSQDNAKTTTAYDLCIIGGGINGMAIAADAAGRGLKVILCDKQDFGAGTSSKSSKLIHGGLRYLEHFEFSLVRESLREREILHHNAPHLVWPLPFILPHQPHTRPTWLIQIGLWLYDHLAGKQSIPKSRRIDLAKHQQHDNLKDLFDSGFQYYDCWGDDSRLVIANALRAKQHAADLYNYSPVLKAKRHAQHWEVTFNRLGRQLTTINSKCLINAAGPWVEEMLPNCGVKVEKPKLSLVRGSHIIINKLYDADHAYLLQHPKDKRIIFVIPYEENYSLIGTTDVIHNQAVDNIKISQQEAKYLCDLVSNYFVTQVNPADILDSFSGVRALYSNGDKHASKMSRDYYIAIDANNKHATALLTVYGGKLTTHRQLAETTVNKLQDYFTDMQSAWTANQILPGGDIPDKDLTALAYQLQITHPWLDNKCLIRYAKTYGSLSYPLLANCKCVDDLGLQFADSIYQRELDHVIEYEFARTAEDFLWRRTKLGLQITPQQLTKIQQYFCKKIT